jgi:hypothetical protein
VVVAVEPDGSIVLPSEEVEENLGECKQMMQTSPDSQCEDSRPSQFTI